MMLAPAINERRLLGDIFAQGKFGWKDGLGLQRIAYSASYLEARTWLKDRMEKAGLETRVDGVGNLFGRLEGNSKKTILMGSHLDSVDNGGIYDGPLGIIAALEVLRAIKESGKVLKHSLEVVAFIGEEGEPLGGTFGSRAFAGLLPADYRCEQLAKFGVSEKTLIGSKGNLDNYAAFLELHIEQGPLLERQGIEIGVPLGIVGITRLAVSVQGVANHAGTTPMAERKDAMRTATELIHDWFQWMDGQADLVCNIGVLEVKPGHVSVVPEKVRFILELRSVYDANVDRACSKILTMAERSAPCCISVEKIGTKPAVILDERLVRMIQASAGKIGYSVAVMSSGASHDSSPIAHVMPAGMIFVPSHDGISHSRDEFSSDADIIRGAEVLKETVLLLDNSF